MNNPNDAAIFVRYMKLASQEAAQRMSAQDRDEYERIKAAGGDDHDILERYGFFSKSQAEVSRLMEQARQEYWRDKEAEDMAVADTLPEMLDNVMQAMRDIFRERMDEAEFQEWDALMAQSDAETITEAGQQRLEQIMKSGLDRFGGDLELTLNVQGGNLIDIIRRYPNGPPTRRAA